MKCRLCSSKMQLIEYSREYKGEFPPEFKYKCANKLCNSLLYTNFYIPSSFTREQNKKNYFKHVIESQYLEDCNDVTEV